MSTYLIKRLVASLFAVWGVATLTFILLRVTADPAALLVGEQATPERLADVRHRLGLDRPLLVQYGDFMSGVVRLDFGESYRFNEPAMGMVIDRLPLSLRLSTAAFVVALVLAIPLAVASAVWRNTVIDYVASFLSFVGFAMPAFWLGAMAIILFSVQLKWLPTSGAGDLKHYILPTATLATWPLGQFTRLLRSELLNVFHEDYVRTARAKGLAEQIIVLRHALKNAFLPVLTLIGLSFGTLLGGAIITETIFAWPGIGRLIIQATLNRDFPLIEASVILLATGFVTINLIVDLLYGVLDPRIKLA
ncbi:MAG: peptide/nickel transport system permease protein [Thermomicrobiales bacterium]|nr:peptide/nickel transport system permease protein [Thermomicrobiales bacterium]MEA2531319.1 peptide/nickel transport system permease protein [Thermomicrobiales bacterium]